ncbi:restriction endonuclease subunit S [Arenibacter palladensis]|uniref:restriction endonuclease subunit S n=1 Tax=Arenibacter palladensis TaxID=237373 RepID=UPI002FD193A6
MSTPKLRFSEFSDIWKSNRLSKVAKVTSGGTPSRSEEKYWNGTIPWVTTSLINFNTIFSSEEYITKKGLQNSSAKLFPIGTILLAMYGQGKTRGKVAILGIEASTNQACSAIIPNDTINNNFLFQNLIGRYDAIRRLSNEGGQQNLSGSIIKGIPIKFPNLSEQQKIASFLSDVDAKITKLTKKAVLLEQYKKGVMQKIFNQELRFKDDNGNDYTEWEVKKLRDLGDTLNGLTGKTKEDFGEGKPYIQYKQIFDSSKININQCGFVEITASDNQTKMQYGDVFFTTSSETPNEIGTASVLLDEVDEMYLNSFCFGFRVKQTLLYPSFSQFLFRSNGFRKKMIPLAQGSTRYNISKSSFLKLKVYLPSIEEQTKIANFLSDIDVKIEALNIKIENSKAFKKGLLQQMFV